MFSRPQPVVTQPVFVNVGIAFVTIHMKTGPSFNETIVGYVDNSEDEPVVIKADDRVKHMLNRFQKDITFFVKDVNHPQGGFFTHPSAIAKIDVLYEKLEVELFT